MVCAACVVATAAVRVASRGCGMGLYIQTITVREALVLQPFFSLL